MYVVFLGFRTAPCLWHCQHRGYVNINICNIVMQSCQAGNEHSSEKKQYLHKEELFPVLRL